MSSTGHRLNEEHFHGGEKLTTEMADTIYRFLYEAKIRKISHISLGSLISCIFTKTSLWYLRLMDLFLQIFLKNMENLIATQKDYFLAKCLLYQQVKPNGIIVLNKKDKKVWSGAKNIKKTNQTINYFTQNNEKERDNCYEIINETISRDRSKNNLQ
jgi:hypothetical protein